MRPVKTLLTLLLLIVVSTASASAAFRPAQKIVRPFIFSLFQGYKPLLEVHFSNEVGVMTEIEGGAGYLSCSKGSISSFRLNFLFETLVAKHFARSPRMDIGVKNPTEDQDISETIGFVDVDIPQSPPTELGLVASTRGFPDVVKYFDALGVDDRDSLYVSSFVDGSFFEKLVRGNRLVLLQYSEGDRTYQAFAELAYKLKKETANTFLKACLDS